MPPIFVTSTEPRDCDLLEALGAFADHLRSEPKVTQLGAVASLWNGFEGWLKVELASMLMAKYGRVAWEQGGPPWRHGTVGVEYHYKRDSVQDREARSGKLIDVWFSRSATNNQPTYYIELKVVFCNANKGKQLDSWRNDFVALNSLFTSGSGLVEDVAGFASLVFAVGFSDKDWSSAVDRLAEGAALWRPRGGDVIALTPADDRVHCCAFVR